MSTEHWYDLSEDEFNEMLKLSRLYRREAHKCLKAKAYLAGCTATGAALEAVLIAIIHIYGEEIDKAGHVAVRNKKPKPLLDWTLAEMQRTAEAMEWLPRGLKNDEKWKSRKAKIGDYAVALRQVRNLIHPARYLQDHFHRKVTRKYLEHYAEVLDVAVQVLNNEVMSKLKEWLDAQEE